MFKTLALAFATLLPLGIPGQVGAQAHSKSSDLHAQPRLVAEQMAAKPGQTLWIAIDFTIEDQWHTYWPGTNDTGFPLQTEIEVHPQIAAAGDLLWPAPHRISSPQGILDHVFEDHMTVLLPLTISNNARLGETVSLQVSMRWLVCKTACIMESAELSIQIPISDAIGRPSPQTAAIFERARSRLPQPITDSDPVTITQEGPSLTLTSTPAERLAFYPSENSRPPRNLLRDGQAEGQTLTIEFRESNDPILGVLEVWTSPTESLLYTIHWPPENNEPRAQARDQELSSFTGDR